MTTFLGHEDSTEVAVDSGEVQEVAEAENGADLRANDQRTGRRELETVLRAVHLAENV